MDSATPTNVVLLTSMFSTNLRLAYAVPLLLFSLLLTFAGAFLTLDRTRSFPPRPDATELVTGSFKTAQRRKKFNFLLEGGIGGIAAGYVFGLHASTFLSLLITNNTMSTPLGKKTFLFVWLLSAIATTLLATRWKYATFTCIGITGGANISLSLSIILHPSLPTRIILTAVFTSLALLLALLPFRQHRGALRALASAIGAFGVILSISLLARPSVPAWADVWERLWTHDSTRWGTQAERGLSAAFFVLWIAGAAVDWALARRFGQNPDEKWDSYLAEYTTRIPNISGRAGTFQPLQSWWTRLLAHFTGGTALRSSKDLEKMLFSPDDVLKPPALTPTGDAPPYIYDWIPSRPVLGQIMHPKLSPSLPSLAPVLLAKPTRMRTRRKPQTARRRVQFRPADGFSSDSDPESEMDADAETLRTPRTGNPWAGVGSGWQDSRDASVYADPMVGKPGKELEYSDGEDIAAQPFLRRVPVMRGAPEWQPAFLTQCRVEVGAEMGSVSSGSTKVDTAPPTLTSREEVTPTQLVHLGLDDSATVSASVGVPLAAASLSVDSPLQARVGGLTQGKRRWEAFWRDVTAKATEGGVRVHGRT